MERGEDNPVTVAVIDTGVLASHPALSGKVVGGYNEVSDNNDYTDHQGHGTHVAGIIAANANDGIGTVGGCWGCKILAEKVLNDQGSGTDADIAQGIDHAVAHGASVLNLSLGGPGRNETVVKALAKAYEANRTVVVAAGNDGSDEKMYPGAYENETFSSFLGLNKRTYYAPNLTVASVDATDHRSSFSNYGDWVDISAPGEDILSTVPRDNTFADEGYPDCNNADYCRLSGTSQATPLVAVAVALVRASHPGIDDATLRQRLKVTSKPLLLTDKFIGLGRLDTFSAVMNSGFDTGGLDDWSHSGTTNSIKSVGLIRPPDGTARMARISTGPNSAVTTSTLSRKLPVKAGSGDITVRFQYDYLSEEYPEYVGSSFNDDLSISLVTPTGARIPLAFESVNTTGWTPVSGINFPGGDSTVGQSGWKTIGVTIPSAQLAGNSNFGIEISDRGDSVYDSEAYIDGIRLS